MKKINTIKKNNDFLYVIKNGKYYKAKGFTLYFLENQNNNNYRFGISIGRKNGKAFFRNKIKRQMREIIYKNENCYKSKDDYLLIIKPNINDLTYNEKMIEFNKALKSLGRKINEK